MKSAWPLLLGLLLLAAPAAVQAQLNYTINAGTVTITGYSGFAPVGVLIIPATLDNLPVTGVADYAFSELTSVTNVTIPASVTNIGVGAFYGCTHVTAIIVDPQNSFYSSTNGVLFDKTLTTLVEFPGGAVGNYTIPEGVSNIGAAAFVQCYGLTNVTIPGSVTNIGEEAFSYCTSLTNVAIPRGVASIGDGAFSGCDSLTAITVNAQNPFYSSTNGVLFDKNQTTLIASPGGLAGGYTIPAGVTTIRSNAFENCQSLASVTIPGSVSNIGVRVFYGCASLTMITVNAQNSFYSSKNGVLFDKNQSTLVDYPGGVAGSYTIPTSVRTIAQDAFENCKGLASVTIPGSVRSIGVGAFENCSSLGNATIAIGVTSIESNAFENCSSLTRITIPGSVTGIGTGAFENCSFLASVAISAGVTSIESNAFENCYSLASVTIPGTVTSIGEQAFDYCLSLASVTIPVSVTNIGEQAFVFCSGLTSAAIPDRVTSLGEETFAYCSSLASVIIPGSVKSIGAYTFYECASLASVTIPASVSNIGVGAFEQCYALANVTIPAGLIGIGNYAFSDCTSLTSVTIPRTVTSIGDGVFSECATLKAITVDAQNSFFSSTNGVLFDKNQTTLIEYPGGLAGSYTIPGSVTGIGAYAFENCPGLTNVTIPGSVTNIGEGAFENCDGLASITIPGSVTNIGDNAFSGTQLTNFYFTGNAPAVDLSVFDSNNNPTVYYLPWTAGWAEFAAKSGISAAPWNPVIQTDDGGFGVQNNQFGFNITGPTNLVVVVEACSNLADTVWTPIDTVILSNGLSRFTEPVRMNGSSRFYGLGFP